MGRFKQGALTNQGLACTRQLALRFTTRHASRGIAARRVAARRIVVATCEPRARKRRSERRAHATASTTATARSSAICSSYIKADDSPRLWLCIPFRGTHEEITRGLRPSKSDEHSSTHRVGSV